MKLKNALSALLTTVAVGLGGAAWADGIGASLLTQQHPFYIELADAMKAEAQAKGVPLEVSIANQDLNKQLADVEDFIVKGVDVIVTSPPYIPASSGREHYASSRALAFAVLGYRPGEDGYFDTVLREAMAV